MRVPPRVLALVGPTATGKSDLAVRLGRLWDAEIVNADAMQLYRGMDIGTAKLPPAERGGVPHHLLDVLDVTEDASVAAYQGAGRDALAGIAERGRPAIVVGGSGLYVRALLDDLRFPGTDPVLRKELEEELRRHGPDRLHDRLRSLDPLAADGIDPRNERRVVRAVEVVLLTGQPFIASLPQPGAYALPALQLGLDRDPGDLDDRVAARVGAMFAAGLVDEVRGLVPRGLREGRTASKALGYAQVLQAFDDVAAGGDEAEAMARAAAATVLATRRFVRRQRSWFRRDPRIAWLDAGRDDLLDAALLLTGAAAGMAG